LKIAAPADNNVPVPDDSNIDFDMESAGMNCFAHHNRFHPYFIANAIVPVCYLCLFNLLSIKLISKNEVYRKCLPLSLAPAS
jgi:hypothetical protein